MRTRQWMGTTVTSIILPVHVSFLGLGRGTGAYEGCSGPALGREAEIGREDVQVSCSAGKYESRIGIGHFPQLLVWFPFRSR